MKKCMEQNLGDINLGIEKLLFLPTSLRVSLICSISLQLPILVICCVFNSSFCCERSLYYILKLKVPYQMLTLVWAL